MTLNVSGPHNKLNHGILDQYFANFHDIISLAETNTDSPGLKDFILNNFTCIDTKRIKQNSRYKYGGIYDICTIVSTEFKDKIIVIPDTESECTLWLKLKLSENDECILGAVYMPCEPSRSHDEQMFSQIENDIVTLKARYKIPICLSGDFNAHRGQDDFNNPDEARKAMFALLERAKVLNLPIDIVCELFYVCVVPVLVYSCEVWGFEDLKDVEIFHRKFLRIILKTFNFTPNVMLYGERGSMDMTTKIHKRMIHF